MRKSCLNNPAPSRTAARASLFRRRVAIFAAALITAAVASSASRAGDGFPVGTISDVLIKGNDSISTEKILAKLKSRAGRELDERLVEQDLKTLMEQTKWFSDVRVFYNRSADGKGYVLIFQVKEMPVIKSIEYRGLTKLKLKEVEETTGLKTGGRADHIRNQLAAQSLERLYHEKGYEWGQVRLLEGAKAGDTKVVFQIFEGPKCRLQAVGFEGNDFVSDSLLKTKIMSGRRFLGVLPGNYRREDIEDDLRKLKEYYLGQGFFEVNVSARTDPDANQGDVRVTFVISEGVQYKVRNLRFEGNERIKTDDLRKGLVMHGGQPFSDTLREVDKTELLKRYGAIGCIDANIEARHEYTDQPGVVDLRYRIEEGNPYMLGRIIVKGNDRTRDSVVRREANMAGLVPGEPLDAHRIELFKQRLTNLRFFAVTPDTGKPLEVKIVNRRPGNQPYGDIVVGGLDEVIRTRLQGPGPDEKKPVRVAQAPVRAPAMGDAPAPIIEPQEEIEVPALEAPRPGEDRLVEPGAAPVPPQDAPGGRTAPVGAGEPPGLMPSIPGMNMTDVGPDRQEPFPNRSFADIVASVDEAPTGRLMFGVGASSYGGLFGSLILHESNFDYKTVFSDLSRGRAPRGGGQDFRVELYAGTQINRVDVSFRNPYVFDLPIAFGASGYANNRFYPDWTEERGGGRFSLGRQFGVQTYADVAFRIEDVNLFGYRFPAPADVLAASGHTTLATIRPTLRFDNRNNPFAASKGQYLEFAFEQGWGTFTYPKFTAEGRTYFTTGSRPDGSGKRLLTLRGFYGVTGPDTPVYERFFAGDFRSMRGFGYRGVGPHVLGTNVGGLQTLLGSIEYQFPWTASDKLHQVIFTDFGTVEPGYDIQNFRVAIGTGLRIYLPQQLLGPFPLALDFAYPILKVDGDKTKVFNFSIGAFW